MMSPEQLFSLAEHLGIESLKYNTSETQLTALCPFHLEARRSFAIGVERLMYNCYSCKARGSLLDLVSRLRNIGRDSAKQIIDRFGPYTIESLEDTLFKFPNNKGRSFVREVPLSYYKPYTTAKRNSVGLGYLRSRGLVYRESGILPTGHEIGYDPEQDRIMFPWYHGSIFVGATGRSRKTTQGTVRYLPYFGLNRTQHLFHGHLGLVAGRVAPKAIVIVEGEIDALRVSALYPDTRVVAVALGGSSPSDVQLELLYALGGPYIVGLDNDDAGKAGQHVLSQALFKKSMWGSPVRWPRKDAARCNNMEICTALRTCRWLQF